MKSSDSRTNSKYKSPYGCPTNSHCEKIQESGIVLKHMGEIKLVHVAFSLGKII